VHLSRHRSAHGRCRLETRPAGRPGLRTDFCGHLYSTQPDRGYRVHRDQPDRVDRCYRAQPAPVASAMTTSLNRDANLVEDVGFAEPPPKLAHYTWLQSAWRELRRAPLTARFGLIVILLYILTALFAPLIAPYPETEIVGGAYEGRGKQFILGTDQLGRDMLSRLI